MKKRIPLGRRIAVLAFLAGVVSLGLVSTACKRTWDSCYDPINPPVNLDANPPCNPTIQVIDCKNPPTCATPGGAPISACAVCASGGAPGCGTSPSCSNSICWKIHTLNYGLTVTGVRAYWPGSTPPAYATPNGTFLVDRGSDSDVYNYTFCSPSLTPVVGIAGQPVIVEVKGQFNDPSYTPMNASTTWRP